MQVTLNYYYCSGPAVILRGRRSKIPSESYEEGSSERERGRMKDKDFSLGSDLIFMLH